MKATTVKTVDDQILERLGAVDSITVEGGQEFERNLWRQFDLPHINMIALAESVHELKKRGLISLIEGSVKRDTGYTAGVMQGAKGVRERVYLLTAAGHRALERAQGGQHDMP